jgi:tetratricopeptide (TPR) repeat protein
MKLALALAIAVVSATPALADPKQPDAATIKKASNHFKLGQEFFKSGQWDRAIAEYQAALDLTGEPLMVFNIALAQDRAGRAEEALAGYLKYLESAPDGAIADEARGYVAKLTPVVDKIKKQHEADAAKQAAADKEKQDAAQRQADEQKKIDAAKQADRNRRADSVDSHAKILEIAGLGVAVIGAGVVGFGIKRGLDAQSISDELSDHQGPWTDAQIARDQDGQDANRQMKIFTAVGAGVIVTGAVLFVVGRGGHGRAERMRVGALPTHGGGAVSFALRF